MMQTHMIFKPDRAPANISIWNDNNVQEMTVHTSDGLSLNAWYRPAENDKPVILFFHGNTGDIGDRAFKAPYFTTHDYGVLLAEYRGYGGNEGTPSEKNLYKDAFAYIDWLNAQNIPDKNIIIYGESLGSGVATYIATKRRVAALILEAPYTSIENIAKARYPYVPISVLLKHKFNSLDRIHLIDTPLLIIHGANDMVVPFSHGQRLYEQAHHPKQFKALQAGHNDLYDYGAAEAIIAFLGSGLINYD
jgi:fermentation-respiration switch protein FrsA (DUF1100 family)